MTERVINEIKDALNACEDAGMPADRVGASLGPHRFTFLILSGRPDRVSEHDKRVIARRVRQALTLWLLEQDCDAGNYAGNLLRYGG